MAIITEVQFAHDDGALADTLRSMPELTVRSVRETSTVPERSPSFFWFDNADPGELRPRLEADHTVRTVTPVPTSEDDRLWAVQFTPETQLLAPRVTKAGGFVLDARSSPTHETPRGWRERWFFPDDDGMDEIWEYARAEEFEFDVLDLSQRLRSDVAHVDPDPLTDQQRETLLTAYERGYFTEPRETSLEELADALDVSPSAVNGRLRRGLKALIGTALLVDGDENENRDGDPQHCRPEVPKRMNHER